MDRRTGSGSDDSATPLGDDLRGEALAGHHVPQPAEFEIAADEVEAEELVEGSDVDGELDDVQIDDEAQLSAAEGDARVAISTEPESLAARVAGSRPARKAVAKKDAPTPSRRRTSTTTAKRTTPGQFVNQSVEELKKVVWPTGRQVQQYFLVVLVFVLFIIAYVVTLDTGFGALLLKLFG